MSIVVYRKALAAGNECGSNFFGGFKAEGLKSGPWLRYLDFTFFGYFPKVFLDT